MYRLVPGLLLGMFLRKLKTKEPQLSEQFMCRTLSPEELGTGSKQEAAFFSKTGYWLLALGFGKVAWRSRAFETPSYSCSS